ncbi:MAG: DUF5706 domain-containing protein [Pseudomonadota bacterium]|nr:DUF5706 domain-containing protein [Pseudomonadota bacterium]
MDEHQRLIDPVPIARTFAPQAVNAARQTTIANMTLSQMADQKASILMGATFLVFTVTLGQASKGGPAVVPLLVLGAFAFIAACFAVSVVMPSIRSKRGPGRAPNMMFFGVISQFDEEEYIERMLDNLATDEAMYRMMFRDIWQNAQVLQHKKYRLLGYAYRSFLAGLIASAALFAAQYFGVRF